MWVTTRVVSLGLNQQSLPTQALKALIFRSPRRRTIADLDKIFLEIDGIMLYIQLIGEIHCQ